MSKASARPSYRCTECGWTTAKWVGRCGECQAWGSVAEAAAPKGLTMAGPTTSPAVPIGQVPIDDANSSSCGVPELDRVLGGGLVAGAVVLLAGEPGVGKSTLLLEVAAQTARSGSRALYVSGEESASQVRLRADRTRGVHHELFLAAETDLGAVLSHIDEVKPKLLVIDSVQTISADGVEGVPGGVTQVKEVAAAIVRMAKTRGISTVIVGHVTKDGSIAGPRVLEHLVDVVLQFEGERASRLRMVRAVKNRFGPVDEVGCFDLSSDGIVAVTDPSTLFVARHHEPVPGTCVTVSLEGKRPMLAEVQALVTGSTAERPRRSTSGVESSRATMIAAVLQQRSKLRLQNSDIFVATVGGARVTEPAADLAIALAMGSAAKNVALRSDIVAMGEIGLAGELRRVPEVRKRLAEAARLGFKSAIIPPEHGSGAARITEIEGLQVFEAPTLAHALQLIEFGDALRPEDHPIYGAKKTRE